MSGSEIAVPQRQQVVTCTSPLVLSKSSTWADTMKAPFSSTHLERPSMSGGASSEKPKKKKKMIPSSTFELSACPDATLVEAYRDYNKKYFKDKLVKNLQVGWTTLLPTDAKSSVLAVTVFYYGTPYAIWLNHDAHHAEDGSFWHGPTKLSLLHEMCHVATLKKACLAKQDYHGEMFQKEMKRLAAADAFKDAW